MNLFKLSFISNAVLSLSVLLCLMIFINGCSPSNSAPKANVPEAAIVILKNEKPLITAELPGRTVAYLTAEVRPEVGGIVQKRLFEEGADVKAGELLYQIEPDIYQAIYDKRKAELDMAEATIVSIKYKFERNKTLIKSHSISQQEFEISESDLYAAQANIEAAKAALEAAKIDLNDSQVKASISGRIGKSDVTVGALVIPNNTAPLATIQQINPIFVDAVQSSSDFLKYKRDLADGFINKTEGNILKVKLYFEDGSIYPFEGELMFRDITVDQSTGSFILRISFPNPEYALLPGMYVRCVIEEGIAKNGILVPHQAVKRNFKGEPIVYLVDNAGKVEERNIVIDHSIEDKWLVRDGLAPGDKLIVEGFQKIRPGIEVKVVNFESKVNEKTSQKTLMPSQQD